MRPLHKKKRATSLQNGSDISDNSDSCDRTDKKTFFTKKLFSLENFSFDKKTSSHKKARHLLTQKKIF